MTYYTTNAIYNKLHQVGNHNFIWTSGNAWTLVYCDSAGHPKLIALVHGSSWIEQPTIIHAINFLSLKSKIPLIRIQFNDVDQQILSVDVIVNSLSGTYTSFTLEELKKHFSSMGLPVNNGICGKYLNDKISSSYHKWQRSALGSIKVSDIDLIRVDQSGNPTEILELKRSYIPLDKWTPYRDDFANFNALLKICLACQIKMYIAYNLRTKTPFLDDPSNISLFSYQVQNTPKHIDIVTFNDFKQGLY